MGPWSCSCCVGEISHTPIQRPRFSVPQGCPAQTCCPLFHAQVLGTCAPRVPVSHSCSSSTWPAAMSEGQSQAALSQQCAVIVPQALALPPTCCLWLCSNLLLLLLMMLLLLLFLFDWQAQGQRCVALPVVRRWRTAVFSSAMLPWSLCSGSTTAHRNRGWWVWCIWVSVGGYACG